MLKGIGMKYKCAKPQKQREMRRNYGRNSRNTQRHERISVVLTGVKWEITSFCYTAACSTLWTLGELLQEQNLTDGHKIKFLFLPE